MKVLIVIVSVCNNILPGCIFQRRNIGNGVYLSLIKYTEVIILIYPCNCVRAGFYAFRFVKIFPGNKC